MFDVLSSVLDTRGTNVFRHTENAGQHKEFRPKVLSFLRLSASETIPGHAKTTPLFPHSKPFLDHQVNVVRHVANLKRKLSRAPEPDDVSFPCSGALNVIWGNAPETKVSDLVADKEAGLLTTHHKAVKDKPLCETYSFS